MKKLSIPCLFLLLLGLAGCSALPGGNKVQGSGVAKTEKRNLAKFTSIEVECHANVNVVSQGQDSFEIGGDDNIVPLITTEVKNNTLYIKSSQSYNPKSRLEIDISVPDVEKFAFTGGGEVTLAKIKNNRLEISITGGGTVKASGETKETTISLTGAGEIDAKDLHAEKAKVTATGAGTVDVYATETLDVNATGVGDINYYGNPKHINKQGAGIGSITQK